MIDLKDHIRTVPDFPIPGIQFRDITSLIENPDCLHDITVKFLDYSSRYKADVIVGIESRGFVFGSPVAWDMGVPFVMARKPGKLPNETFKKSFDLEYGSTSLEIQKNTDISADSKIIIIDDLIATGGTAEAAAKLVEISKSKVASFMFVINLFDLGGCDNLIKKGYKVENLIEFPGH